MDRDHAIRILGEHAEEIRAKGVTWLALFGSTARNEARASSDIDLLVDIDEGRKLSLIDLAGLRLYLCDILGREVEITERANLKPSVKDDILAEAVDVI